MQVAICTTGLQNYWLCLLYSYSISEVFLECDHDYDSANFSFVPDENDHDIYVRAYVCTYYTYVHVYATYRATVHGNILRM